MIFIVVKSPVAPEHADHWLSLVGAFTEATRAEEGNLFFEWYRSVEDPTVYLLVEGYRDRAAGDAHVASEHFKKATTELPKWLAGPPEIVHVQTDTGGWDKMREIDDADIGAGGPQTA